eukprot:NODE_8452_length_677_cov_31.944043_g7828_i0.p1 GENE.NODE_8452_length_677_cov_31.944043_g7828_i0~~NODE_8452_length_677_cov_31.944043_g7828_i0.p1  ORF type:complete len:189 (-),score=39.83 NODE_8452_length_677_cov_31.944043_g7828_i0:31-597(-)
MSENDENELLTGENLLGSSLTAGDDTTQTIPTFSVLSCSSCGFPIVKEEDLIEERIDTWSKVVYAYQLAVLDKEIWCYSATNPSDRRFDVARVKPCMESTRITGKPTPEHTWFPGYSWSMASCKVCGAHLGWGFSKDQNAEDKKDTLQTETENTTLAPPSTDTDVEIKHENTKEDPVTEKKRKRRHNG